MAIYYKQLVHTANLILRQVTAYSTQMASGSEEKAAAVRVIGGWACPYAIRVFAALKLKGVEYEFLQEPTGRKSELLLKSGLQEDPGPAPP